ncbi:PfaD family polyunsaturated fatty acid/polyketide biosynthesis protein [Hyphomonas johnsonii]|uniref:2-nitropropane dioxygenase n=1 Tax=Hyphomonas johnsonii MHS-2 TaxID=1280950 RepID=A0A059FV10_9PROT|nr:PfaD family polyunsaturated fatty acid/polyketide biosynthesis protein [Hyphomonas johnsonii]KCZ94293.1 2-nitropropane dioxygenase [Hyphomonas johnsonii MHS-2]
MSVSENLDKAITSPREPVALGYSSSNVLEILQDRATSPAGTGALALPPIYPEWLGDRLFSHTHGCRFNYVVGEMARGIATTRMVCEAVKAGCVGFYGSAGLTPQAIEAGLDEIRHHLTPQQTAWGANLIHAPQQPGYEARVVDLFLLKGVRRVSASAFMQLSPDLVRYTAVGLSRAPDGSIRRENHVFAKVSRAEVAEPFMAPAPAKILSALVASGAITPEQAELAAQVPVAAEITAESDSGGHTDNRPASVLFPSLCLARDRVAARTGVDANAIRIGLAGGISTPQATAAAFQMGAAFVLTGSINQCAVESGLSEAGRRLLAKAGPADMTMAPAADMFEQGVEVQVLKRGTLFAMRGKRLHAMYRSGASYETLPQKDRDWLDDVLGEPFDAAWQKTEAYIQQANPAEAKRAAADGNKRLALVARRYLFMGAQWAREGTPGREMDYQIWCGPAMGVFNEWTRGTFLETVENRTVRQIAWNLLEGAAQITRAGQLRALGLPVSPSQFSYSPHHFSDDE